MAGKVKFNLTMTGQVKFNADRSCRQICCYWWPNYIVWKYMGNRTKGEKKVDNS